MKNLFAVVVLLSFAACSTAKVRVMPGEKSNKVVVRDIERDTAETEAANAATEYCKEREKEAVFIEQTIKYTGDMDEETRKTVRKGSKVATVLGGYNSPVGKAGYAGRQMTGDRDYLATVVFRCR